MQTTVEIAFRPSTANAQAQVFELQTDVGAVGPEGDVIVQGTGVEAPGQTADARIAATNQKARQLESDRKTDALRGQRVEASAAVQGWAADAQNRTLQAADWSRENWTDFIGRTGGDYTLYRTSTLMNVIRAGVGTWLEFTFEPENLIAHVFAKQAVEHLVDYFFDKLGDEPPEPDARIFEATKDVARTTIEKGREINVYRDRADLVIKDAEATAELRIEQSKSASDLAQWSEWAKTQQRETVKPKSIDDRSLRDELLKEWVLQRAASPTSANKHTNPEAWNEARERLEQSEQLPTLKRPDLFLHQCRYEWERLGFAGIDQGIAILASSLQQHLGNAKAWGRSEAQGARMASAFISDANRTSIEFDKSEDPARTAREFRVDFVEEAVGTAAQLREGFSIQCRFQLDTQGEGVFVKCFHYEGYVADNYVNVDRAPR